MYSSFKWLVKCMMNSAAWMMWSKQLLYLFNKCSGVKSIILLLVQFPFSELLSSNDCSTSSGYSHPEISHIWGIDFSSLIILWIFSFIQLGLSLSLLQSGRVFKYVIIFLWLACALAHSSISSCLIALKQSDSLSTLMFLSKFRALFTPGFLQFCWGSRWWREDER